MNKNSLIKNFSRSSANFSFVLIKSRLFCLPSTSSLHKHRAIHLEQILSPLEISQIANSSCILNSKKFRQILMFMLHVLAPLLPSLHRSRCQDVWHVWGFRPKKNTKETRKISRKIDRWIETKNVYLVNTSIKSFHNKRFTIRPNHNVVVLYYNLFEMPIWYRIEFFLVLRFAVNRQPQKQSDDGNYVWRCRETI